MDDVDFPGDTVFHVGPSVDNFKQLRTFDAPTRPGSPEIYHAYVDAAEQMLEEDVKANKAMLSMFGCVARFSMQAIGDAGADAILAAMKAAGREGGARVMTICNTGALATAGWGTALGVLRTLHARGRLLPWVKTDLQELLGDLLLIF